MENKQLNEQELKMKSLLSKLEGAIKATPEQAKDKVNNTNEDNTNEKKEVTKERKPRKKKKPVAAESDIINQIRSIEIDDTSAASIHIRFPAHLHAKLLAMKMAKVTAQKVAVFAVMRLMDDPEIKDVIKNILNDLE